MGHFGMKNYFITTSCPPLCAFQAIKPIFGPDFLTKG